MDLDAIITDMDQDVTSLRWEVDGVLMDATVDELEINASHEIHAIVRDARGATSADLHAITCSGP